MCLLQLSCIDSMVQEEDIECDLCMKELKMMWNTVLNDVLKLKPSLESSADSASDSSGHGSPNTETFQPQRLSFNGVYRKAMARLRNVLNRQSQVPAIQIIPHDCNGDPPKLCCSQDENIKVTQWANFHADTIYIGVCKGSHVHFAIQSK